MGVGGTETFRRGLFPKFEKYRRYDEIQVKQTKKGRALLKNLVCLYENRGARQDRKL